MQENKEKNTKRNKIIGISIGIIAILCFVAVGTYAYWQLTRTQEDTNELIAACLSFTLTDASAENTGITLNNAWPMSDEDALSGHSNEYSFIVTNNCPAAVYYDIGLERFSTSKDIGGSSITVGLDGSKIDKYSALIDMTKEDNDAIAAKRIGGTTVAGNGSNTHVLKLWINDSAPVSEQGKGFTGRIFIIGGQNIKSSYEDGCYTISSSGKITNYDNTKTGCGTVATIPATVSGIPVTSISSDAFKEVDGEEMNMFDGTTDICTYYKGSSCEEGVEIEESQVDYNLDQAVGVPNSTGTGPESVYLIKKSNKTDSEFRSFMVEVLENQEVPAEMVNNAPIYSDFSELPDLSKNTYVRMFFQDSNFHLADPDYTGATLWGMYVHVYTISDTSLKVTGLDLSNATNLKSIDDLAFTTCNVVNNIKSDSKINVEDWCTSASGLTSLNFGNNTNDIKLGNAVFAFADLDNLTVYTSLHDDDSMAFAVSNIGSLTYKPANGNGVVPMSSYTLRVLQSSHDVYVSMFNLAYIENTLTFDEGITEIDGITTVFDASVVNLPSTLSKLNLMTGDTINVNMTENEFNERVTLTDEGGEWRAESATVNFLN